VPTVCGGERVLASERSEAGRRLAHRPKRLSRRHNEAVRILHLVDRLTERGGAYRHLIGVIEALSQSHVQLVAAGEDDATTRVSCAQVLVAGLESRRRVDAAADEVVAEFAPDVIHLHTVVNPAVLEWAARLPAIITVQDHRYFCPARGKWTRDGRVCREAMSRDVCRACFENDVYFEEILRLTQERLAAVRRLSRVIVLSQYMKNELAAGGVSAERIDVIPPFVHGLDPTAEPDGPACVLFVGRLSESKGVREAIDAWRASGVPLPLVFSGTGPLRREIEASGLEVLGWLDRAGLSRTYRRARAVILPSRWQEPFGIAGLEALAMGVPVVAYDSGGVGEWHPGGGLVAWGDVAALARALRAVVERASVCAPARLPDRAAVTTQLLTAYTSCQRQ
jgi:glycosyltransferase involved in cell wall biosynthesis